MGSMQQKILKEKIRHLPDLPTLSASVLLILRYLREPVYDRNKVLGALNRDQVLVAEILKLINSGFYGLSNEVTTVDHAVNLLGSMKLKELLYSVSVMDAIAGKDETLWLHSYSSFCLMEDLIKLNPGLDVAGSLPLTMLMHDIGQVVLDKLNPTSHKVAFGNSGEQRIPLHISERNLLGVDHADAGGWLMEFWDMGPDTIIPIAYHHSNEIPEAYIRETALLQVADYIDSYCRDIPALYVSKELMSAAGILEFDRDYWQNRHARMIEALDKSNPAFKLIKAKDSKEKKEIISAESVAKENAERFKVKEFDFEVERCK